jgi:hypothetical protein
MADANSTLDILQELIETCRDGETGYAMLPASQPT